MEERFWSKVEKSENCWNWTAGKNTNGYGRFKLNGKMVSTHRLSWETHNGKITDGLYVLHKCDNPACVRPDHLFLGTQRDNMDDKVKKGRQSKGEKHGMFGKGHLISGEKAPMFGRTGKKHPMFGRTGKKHPMFGRTGEKAPNVKISKQDVLDIRLLYKETNFTQTEIGVIFGIGKSQVGRIITRKQWKHV